MPLFSVLPNCLEEHPRLLVPTPNGLAMLVAIKGGGWTVQNSQTTSRSSRPSVPHSRQLSRSSPLQLYTLPNDVVFPNVCAAGCSLHGNHRYSCSFYTEQRQQRYKRSTKRNCEQSSKEGESAAAAAYYIAYVLRQSKLTSNCSYSIVTCNMT